MQKTATAPAFSISELIHTIIGIAIMICGRYLSSPTLLVEPTQKLIDMGFPLIDGQIALSISQTGMLVIGLFFGIIYLWTFVSTVWPCFLGVFMLGASSYAPFNQVFNMFLGNPMTIQIFFLYIFAAALVQSNVAAYLSRYLMTHKMVEGRPWVLTGVILLTAYLVAFLDQISSVFIMWPAVYAIFKDVGYKKGDKYVSLMIVNVIAMILCSFSTDAIKGGSFYLLSGLYAMIAANPNLQVESMSYAAFLTFGITVSISVLFILLALMRFVFKVDVTPLKNFDVNILKKNELPPMNWQQKTIIVLFMLYALYMLLPGILPKTNPIAQFLSANIFGGTCLLAFALTFIQYKGKHLTDLQTTMAAYPMGTFFLIAVALLFGAAVNAPATNVSIFLEYVLRDWFGGLGFSTLLVLVIILAIIVTNFLNSVAAGLIFAPVIIAVCNAYGFNPSPVLACFFYAVLFAIATPAGSPFAAMLFANWEWISKKDVLLYGITASLIVIAVLVFIGAPLATMLF